MMYYCEFSEDKNLIQGFLQSRTVSRYLIVDSDSIPGQVGYKAKTIVALTPRTKDFYWYKHRDKQSVMLTKEEQQELMLQILKSETW